MISDVILKLLSYQLSSYDDRSQGWMLKSWRAFAALSAFCAVAIMSTLHIATNATGGTSEYVLVFIVSSRHSHSRTKAARVKWGTHENVRYVVQSKSVETAGYEIQDYPPLLREECAEDVRSEGNKFFEMLRSVYAWALSHTNAKWFALLPHDSNITVAALKQIVSELNWRDHFVIGSAGLEKSREKDEIVRRCPQEASGLVVSKPVAEFIVRHTAVRNPGSFRVWLAGAPFRSKVTWVATPETNIDLCREVDTGQLESKKKIWINFIGGLGNQLFLWSSAMGIAKSSGAKLCSQSQLLQKVFCGPFDPPCEKQKASAVWEESGYAKYERLQVTGDTELRGYFQSFRYFHAFAPLVRAKLVFKAEVESEAMSFLETAKKMSSTVVGIHVRRGDHLTLGYLRFPKDEYFVSAMRRFPNATFVVVSNDMVWCKGRHFLQGERIVFASQTGKAEVDLAILANCNHVIITVGTFGWWAGWLSGGTVIYSAEEHDMTHPVNMGRVRQTDYYPSDWISLST